MCRSNFGARQVTVMDDVSVTLLFAVHNDLLSFAYIIDSVQHGWHVMSLLNSKYGKYDSVSCKLHQQPSTATALMRIGKKSHKRKLVVTRAERKRWDGAALDVIMKWSLVRVSNEFAYFWGTV